MKSVSYLGLCWLTTFGLVAVALGQQQTTEQPFPLNPSAIPAAAGQPASEIQQLGAPATQQDQPHQPAFNQPAGTQQQSGASGAMSARQPRGEIGVWMIESGGPGVEIARITGGSAAERAGLRAGDIILQVNGRGASSPQNAAQLIRQVQIGQPATLTIWRDGDQRQLQVTMQPARESYQVGFRGDGETASGDLAARTMRLEKQLNTLMQELQQMRQEMAQLRTAGAQPSALGTEPTPGTTPSSASPPTTTPPQATETIAPPPGFAQPEANATPPSAEPSTPSATPAAAPDAAPAGEKAAATDPFGNDASPPKAEEAPKSDKESKPATESDSLFQ